MAEFRCGRGLMGHGHCELAERHHGPCTSGPYRVFHFPRPCDGGGHDGEPCPECTRLIAEEVIRLGDGGELRPLQRQPTWFNSAARRSSMLAWAQRVLAQEAASG